MEDIITSQYFNENNPEYSTSRFDWAIEFINSTCDHNIWLADIGCGTGNILESISVNTPIENLCGIDVSKKNLEKLQAELNIKRND